ncbi:MAG TPA: hypothetical protein VHR47_14265, partial [Bacillota bacterium]|nr:hypothetical protein [Bacillota bacterium]
DGGSFSSLAIRPQRFVSKEVETKEQLEYLKGEACETVQGYLFSKPVPAEEAIKLGKQASIIID